MAKTYLQSNDNIEETRQFHHADAYDTPASLAVASVNLLAEISPLVHPMIFDPGIGDFGPFGWALSRYSAFWQPWGCDIRQVPERPWYRHIALDCDYLSAGLPVYDIITGNPPFSQAQLFIERSMDLLSEHGLVFFLLKLRFLESEKRAETFFPMGYLKQVFVLPRRPSWWLYKRPPSRGEAESRATNSEPYAFYLFTQKKIGHEPLVSWRLRWSYDEALEKQFRKEAQID